jgi:hypothetical protein
VQPNDVRTSRDLPRFDVPRPRRARPIPAAAGG